MPYIIRQYGPVTEITETEKNPKKVRVHTAREWHAAYEARRPDSIRRTKKICVRRVLAAIEKFGSPLLVTLTFRGDASDASYANDALRRFQVRLQDQFPGAQSIFIPELSPTGRIHFHGLLFGVPLHLGDTRQGKGHGARTVVYGDERKGRVLAALWGEGFVDATKTDGSGRLATYISKYITKGAGHVIFNAMHVLRISRGFPKEVILRGELAEEMAKKYYASKEPVDAWEGDNPFLGKITKKIYRLDI